MQISEKCVYLRTETTRSRPEGSPSDIRRGPEKEPRGLRKSWRCWREKLKGGVSRKKWSDGRVARQRSAKPCTAVRIRFRPHRNRVAAIYNAVLFLNCHTFVIPTFIRGWFLQYKITSYRYPDEFGGLLDSFYHLILAIVFGLHLV